MTDWDGLMGMSLSLGVMLVSISGIMNSQDIYKIKKHIRELESNSDAGGVNARNCQDHGNGS